MDYATITVERECDGLVLRANGAEGTKIADYLGATRLWERAAKEHGDTPTDAEETATFVRLLRTLADAVERKAHVLS